MTTDVAGRPGPGQWLAGARPRTLPAALAPVLAGSGVAAFYTAFTAVAALLAAVVALALQVGVNYANDYSDGIRGTDTDRVGPLRLVGSGLARPGAVRTAAFASFAVAGLGGTALVLLTGHWWLLAVGVACVLAAWLYTGGPRPYGYAGFGELFVFVFFGLVAVGGTVYVQLGRVTPTGLLAGVGAGALSCALLVVNNLRDLAGDRAVGKHTLAVRLGDRGTRRLYLTLVVLCSATVPALAATTTWWALLGLAGPLLLLPALAALHAGAVGPQLVAVLRSTGSALLVWSIGLTAGLLIGR